MFSKKLDLIINLLGIKVSKLAHSSMVDPSYISKLRTGARKLPKNPIFFDDMCRYIVNSITSKEQEDLICNIIGLNSWHENKKIAKEQLKNWFLGLEFNDNNMGKIVDYMLDSLKHVDEEFMSIPNKEKISFKKYYYGVDGKREAALLLLDYILKQKKPTTLYLNSEENMSWMQDDKQFIKLWEEKFTRVIAAGNRVIIIHNTNRNINEMIYGAAKWASIYMNGIVESYYYPGIRDNILQRTIFIAENLVALSSLSINYSTNDMLNQVITDKTAIKALKKEFHNFLSLCKPLAISINKSNLKVLLNIYNTKIKNRHLTLQSISPLPSILTMSTSLAKKLQEKMPNSNILNLQKKAKKIFINIIQHSKYTELIQSPTIALGDDFKEDNVLFADFLGITGIRYSQDELMEHYHNIEQLSKTYPNYQVLYTKQKLKNQMLFSLDNEGFILARPTGKNIMSIFMQDNIINSYNNYISKQIIDLKKV